MSDTPKMGAQSDADARAMAALGGSVTDPDPKATADRAAAALGVDLSKAEGTPTKEGPAGQDKANGAQMSPGPVLNKGKEEEEDDDEEEKEEMERSTDAAEISEDLLIKSLDEAIAIAREGSPDVTDRRVELAEKLSKGDATAEEMAELSDLLKSDADDDEDLDKSLTEAVLSDPDIVADHKTDDGIDVSGFLARQAAFVGGALDQIRGETKDQLTKGFTDISRFNVALAKANRAMGQRLVEQGELIKSLTGRLESVENTPATRRPITGAAQLKKSLPGNSGEGVTRQHVVEGLTSLNKSSADGRAPCGMEITEATARFESTGQIHPALMADVMKAIGR